MKKLTFIMLSVMFPTLMLADYQFIVENSTMVDTYFNIFNAISAIFSSDDYIDLLRLAFLLGGFFVFGAAVLKSWQGQGGMNLIAPYGTYLAVGVAMLTLVFSNKETMWITTNNIPSYCSTTSPTVGTAVELPGILGYVFTTTNTVGRNLTILAESAFSTPSPQGTASMTDSNGYLGSLKETIKLLSLDANQATMLGGTVSTGSSDFTSMWQEFFNTCIYSVANNKGQEGNQIINEMKKSKDLYNWSKNHLDYAYTGSSKKVGEYLIELNGGHLECRTFFSLLEDSINELRTNYSCAFPLSHGGVLELITGGNPGGTGGLSQLNEIAIQAGLINALSSSGKISSIGISGTGYATGKTIAETNQNNLASASYMAQMLPYIQMTMRAVLYAFFPFVFVVMLLPGGTKVLTQYAQTLIWIELWGPTAAVVNMFVNIQVKSSIGEEFSKNGLTLMSSIDMLGEANTIAGVGAMLYLSIPALTWLILKGSGQMLGNVATGVMATFTKNLDSKAVAQDMAQAKASAKSGKSITETINSLEQLEATNKYGQAIGFDRSGGMNKMLDVKSQQAEGQNKFDIANVLSQGGNYVSNQATLGEQKGANETGNVAGYNNGGGFEATKNQSQINVESGLKTTTANVKDAGGASNVADTKSQMENKEFNKLMKVNDGTTKDMFEKLGEKDASVISGTSEVVDKVGAESYKDLTIQEELTKTLSAEKKKETAGSNENVAKTESDMNDKNFVATKTINENTTKHDFENKGKTETINITSDSKNIDKHGMNKLETNLVNQKNEKAIKEDKRYSLIQNKDDFFGQQATQDFKTKEEIEALKYDTNGDGRTSDIEIDKGAKLEDNKAKGAVLSEQVKQEQLKAEGIKLKESKSELAKQAVKTGESTENIDKDMATALAFGSSAQVATDTFNKGKDVKNIEEMNSEGKTSEDLGHQEASTNVTKLEELKIGKDNLAKDISEVVDIQAQNAVATLREKGVSDASANRTVMNDMANRNLYSGKIIQGALGADLNNIEEKRNIALAKTGLNEKSVKDSSKTIEHFEKMSNNQELSESSRKMFAQQAQQMKDKVNSYEKINKDFDNKKQEKFNEYQNRGLIKVGENGEVLYRDTVKDLQTMDKEKLDLYVSKIQGSSNAQKTSFVDMEGMDISKIKDIQGNNTTNIARATQEWSKTGTFRNDIQFHAVKEGYIDPNTMANINTTVNAIKEISLLKSTKEKFLK